jgi:hypothetical protein
MRGYRKEITNKERIGTLKNRRKKKEEDTYFNTHMSRFMPLPGADSLQNTTLSSPNTRREAMDTVSPRAIAAKVKNLI